MRRHERGRAGAVSPPSQDALSRSDAAVDARRLKSGKSNESTARETAASDAFEVRPQASGTSSLLFSPSSTAIPEARSSSPTSLSAPSYTSTLSSPQHAQQKQKQQQQQQQISLSTSSSSAASSVASGSGTVKLKGASAQKQRASSNLPSSPVTAFRAGRDRAVRWWMGRSSGARARDEELTTPARMEDYWRVTFAPDLSCYELIGPICGVNDFALMFAARHKESKLLVGAKFTDLSVSDSIELLEEAGAAAARARRLRHSHLMPCFQSFVVGHGLWTITAPVYAGTCNYVMRTFFPQGLPELAVAVILKYTLRALEYLHDREQLVHNDVRAENIFLDFSGTIRLGALHNFTAPWLLEEHLGERGIQGLPEWTAPELLLQNGIANPKTDIFSLGMTALELKFNGGPYKNVPPLKILYMKLSGTSSFEEKYLRCHDQFQDYKERREVSPEFEQFLRMCLDDNPDNRLTAKELLHLPFIKKALGRKYLLARVANVVRLATPNYHLYRNGSNRRFEEIVNHLERLGINAERLKAEPGGGASQSCSATTGTGQGDKSEDKKEESYFNFQRTKRGPTGKKRYSRHPRTKSEPRLRRQSLRARQCSASPKDGVYVFETSSIDSCDSINDALPVSVSSVDICSSTSHNAKSVSPVSARHSPLSDRSRASTRSRTSSNASSTKASKPYFAKPRRCKSDANAVSHDRRNRGHQQ